MTCSNFSADSFLVQHGVGLAFIKAVLGPLKQMVVVNEQAQPDPDFPTTRYPNPEESGALDLAKTVADRSGVSLIIANDPDADRFSAAEKIDGRWVQFSGDQIGVLLAAFLLDSGELTPSDWALTTAVSSQMLFAMGKGNFKTDETLTGFKWLGNKAIETEKHGETVKFAYEEALGYMLPQILYDKDGISAAILFLRACTSWGSPWAKLQQLYQRYGYFETLNTYWKSPNVAVTNAVFERVRALGSPHPTTVAGRQVFRWRDLTMGYDSKANDHEPDLPTSPDIQMITCWLKGKPACNESIHGDYGVRFTVRTSGTEPKIKSKYTPAVLSFEQSTYQLSQYTSNAQAKNIRLLVTVVPMS